MLKELLTFQSICLGALGVCNWGGWGVEKNRSLSVSLLQSPALSKLQRQKIAGLEAVQRGDSEVWKPDDKMETVGSR